MAARDTANALRTLVGAARGVAANLPDLDSQLHLLDTGRDVMDKSVNLMQEAKLAVEDPDNPENRQKLAQVRDRPVITSYFTKLPWLGDGEEIFSVSESSYPLPICLPYSVEALFYLLEETLLQLFKLNYNLITCSPCSNIITV